MTSDVAQIDSYFVNYNQTTTPERLHRILAAFNRRRLAPQQPTGQWRREMLDDLNHRILEEKFLEAELQPLHALAQCAPDSSRLFVAWFQELEHSGPGQGDPLFPWLAEEASLGEMTWVLEQEVAGEAGFEDLVALTQVKFPTRAKLELARNYWDEMGRGDERGMHGPMLSKLATSLALNPQIETTVTEALSLGNVMIGLASNRRYAYHSIGALGVIELTAPSRAKQVAAGLKRLGVSPKDRHYFDVHAVLDVKHSISWNREVLSSLVDDDPASASAIAAGALLRLTCGARCFERYRRQFPRASFGESSYYPTVALAG